MTYSFRSIDHLCVERSFENLIFKNDLVQVREGEFMRVVDGSPITILNTQLSTLKENLLLLELFDF